MPFDLNDPETKTAIDAIKTAADAKLDSEVSGLKTKVDELIAANKKLKKGQEIDPAEVERLETENDKLRTDLTTAQKAAKDAATVAEKAAKALEAETGFTQKLLIQDGLKSALLANGVKDEDFIDSLTAKFVTGASIVADGDARKAMYGDKPIADYIKDWAGSDVGKKFVAAPVNTGGGATGGGTAAGADLSKLSPVERITAARAAGAKT